MRRRIRETPLLVALFLVIVTILPSPAGPAVANVRAAEAPAGSISGTVTAPAGTVLTQVVVNAWPTDRSGQYGWAGVAADGSYTVGGLAPGGYTVEFNGWSAGLILQEWNGAGSLSDATAVNVGSGPVTGINAQMTLGATVSGTIHTNSDCDLTRVHVYLRGAPGRIIPDGVVEPNGHWSVRGLPTSDYTIEFEGRYAGLSRTFWNGLGSPDLRSVLPVTAGETRTGIDITLDGPTGCVGSVPYVVRVYHDLLQRYPDNEGLYTWGRLLAEGTPYGAVANSITGSDEYRTRLIRATYQRYLGRDAEPAGLANWLAQMRAGWQIEGIQGGFLASDEFYARFGSTPAGWVGGLYQTVLGRVPSSSETQWWVAQIYGGVTRRDVALGFVYSTEHLTSVVDGYYVDLLRRHIDPSGQATWVGLIQYGHRDEEIVAAIISSNEYLSSVGK